MKLTATVALKDNFSDAMKKASKSTEKFAKDVTAAKKHLKELKAQKADIKLRYDTAKAERDIKKFENNLKRLNNPSKNTITVKVRDQASSVLNGIGSKLSKLGGVVGGVGLLGAAGGAGYGVTHSVRMAGEMEQTQLAMGTMLKDKAAGQKMVADLKKFAVETPFEFKDIVNNARFALAMGFKQQDIMSLMTDVGNATSGLGKGPEGMENMIRALGQMQAKGKVSAQEINQLAENGVRAWEYIAKSIGKTTAQTMKLSENGLIPADKAIQAIRKGMQNDFGGMMKEQSKTLLGLFSTVKDFVNLNVFWAFGEGIRQGVLPYLSKFVEGLTNNEAAMKRFQDGLISVGKGLGEFVGRTFENMYNWIQKISSDETFRKLSFGEKVIFIMQQALDSVNKWINGPGQKPISDVVKSFVNIMTTVLRGSMETLMPVAIEIGVGLGKGIVQGIGKSITEYNQIPFAQRLENAGNFAQKMPFATNKFMGKYMSFAASKLPKKASGISYVPRDNYPAMLHKGERVLTSAENNGRGAGGGISIVIPKLADQINASSAQDVDSLLSKLEDKLFEVASNMGSNVSGLSLKPGGA